MGGVAARGRGLAKFEGYAGSGLMGLIKFLHGVFGFRAEGT